MDDAERAFRDALHRVDSVKIPVPSLEPAEMRRGPGLGIRMSRWLAAAAVLAVVAGIAVWAVAGRGQTVAGIPAARPTAVAGPLLTGTTWIAVEFHGKATVFAPEKMPFLEFKGDSTFSGADPCNGIGGTYRQVGSELRITHSGSSTLIGCNPTQQRTFLSVLEDTRQVVQLGDTIEMLDQAGTVVARFRNSDAYTQPPDPVEVTPTATAVTPARKPEPTPTVAAVWVRIRNASSVDFTDVYAIFPNEKKVHYGPVAAGATSRYEPVVKAYAYSYLKVTTGGEDYVFQPVDFVGETELANGHYGYVLDIADSQVHLTLEHD